MKEDKAANTPDPPRKAAGTLPATGTCPVDPDFSKVTWLKACDGHLPTILAIST